MYVWLSCGPQKMPSRAVVCPALNEITSGNGYMQVQLHQSISLRLCTKKFLNRQLLVFCLHTWKTQLANLEPLTVIPLVNRPKRCHFQSTFQECTLTDRWALFFLMFYARGGQLILPGGHFQKAAFSGEDTTFLWKQKQVSVKLGSALTFTMVRWRIFQIWKFS